MKEYIIPIAIIVFSLFVGFIFGHFIVKGRKDGTIVVEMTEDGERERVRFVLEMDLDEIKSRRKLLLGVENHISKNSQIL